MSKTEIKEVKMEGEGVPEVKEEKKSFLATVGQKMIDCDEKRQAKKAAKAEAKAAKAAEKEEKKKEKKSLPIGAKIGIGLTVTAATVGAALTIFGKNDADGNEETCGELSDDVPDIDIPECETNEE